MIFIQLTQQLESLIGLLEKLNNEQYSRHVQHLSKASIGAHTRHVIELLQCIQKGYGRNECDYLNRTRDHTLDLDKRKAINSLKELQNAIKFPDKPMILITELDDQINENLVIYTTYYREIVYNTEHTIHHLALIKVALIEMNLDFIDNNFGVAYSTLKNNLSSGNIPAK